MVNILSGRRTEECDPTVWIEAEWDDYCRRYRVCTDIEGRIRHCKVFEAE